MSEVLSIAGAMAHYGIKSFLLILLRIATRNIQSSGSGSSDYHYLQLDQGPNDSAGKHLQFLKLLFLFPGGKK